MLPTLVEGTNGLGIRTYGLFIMCAFAAAFLITYVKGLRVGIHPVKLIPVYLASAVGGLLGGRVLYILAVEPGVAGVLADPASLFQGSGFAMYGGLIGGALMVAPVALFQKIPFWKLADIAAPSVLVGMGTGRLGCFFAGCCHGAVAPIGPNPTGVLSDAAPLDGQLWLSGTAPFLTNEVHGGVGRLLDLPLYPTQLWSAAYLIALCALLLALWDRRRFDGQLAALFLILEPPFRFAVEAFRGDQRGYSFTVQVSETVTAWLPPGMSQAGTQLQAGEIGLTTSQGIGTAILILGVAIYAFRRNEGVAEEIPLIPAEDEDEDEDDELA